MTEKFYTEREGEGLKEECGVFGMYDFDGKDVAGTIYYGLLALQHRGQESCGIAVSDTAGPKGKVASVKEMGLVNEAFHAENIGKLKGDIGVGHVRYSTAGSSTSLRKEESWRIGRTAKSAGLPRRRPTPPT